MNDPWDVKSVRQPGQYVSCMKINGIPLLPPVLSKECRKEMQYYKLLAKEIQKRIKQLNSYTPDSDDSTDTKTDASEISESDKSFEVPPYAVQTGVKVNTDKITAITTEKFLEKCRTQSHKIKNSPDSLVVPTNSIDSSCLEQQKFIIDVSLSINENDRNVLDSVPSSPKKTTVNELPERDYDSLRKSPVSSPIQPKNEIEKEIMDVVSFSFSVSKNVMNSGPKSDLSSVPLSAFTKRFSGSLNNLESESLTEPQKLIRQRSYTVLNPSPQLLAHLQDQAISSGVEVNSISMSESQCNLSLPLKKRRSWDLESAKQKWSSMAIELNQKRGVNKIKINGATKTIVSKFVSKKSPQPSSYRSKQSFHLSQQKPKPTTFPNFFQLDPSCKGAPISSLKSAPSEKTVVKESPSPKTKVQQVSHAGATQQSLASTSSAQSEDPATRIRELYDKVQLQQTKQMASLMEKQKKEQLILQKVFEEQNSILFNQLKNICPKPPLEAKEAWSTKEGEIGPVSLSQLINSKSDIESTTSSTLLHCDNVLKQSRDITNSIKAKTRSKSPSKRPSPKRQTHESAQGYSPTKSSLSTVRSASRKLRYDSSASSDKEYEPILTDRTNDTFADLNVTFPSDHTDDQFYGQSDRNTSCNSTPVGSIKCTDSAIKHMEETIQKSMQKMSNHNGKRSCGQPTPQELDAANRIVAHAKGYLVRRLMRTERVQTTVQTIRDALLCALQLHQDREGIRGADVDLHRRLIQQITAACYTLHDTFVASTAAERCALIAADRTRRALAQSAARAPHANRTSTRRGSDIMSQSHSGAFPSRARRVPSPLLMTQSSYGNPGCVAEYLLGMLYAFLVVFTVRCFKILLLAIISDRLRVSQICNLNSLYTKCTTL